MSKIKKRIDEKQISLFTYLEPEIPPSPGSMDVSMRLHHAVSNVIKKSVKDRIDICAEIYKLSGKELPNWLDMQRSRPYTSLTKTGRKSICLRKS